MKRGSRLSGGRFRGRRLQAPAGVRPTEGRVREALANIWMPELDGARVLDLFAGTGAVGLELLGRGASAVMLVERSPAVVRVLRENIDRLGAAGASLRRLDLPAGLGKLAPATYDLIFADPPYAFGEHPALQGAAAAVAAPEAKMVIEHGADRRLESGAGWCLVDERRYGDAALSFFELAPSG